MDILAYHPEKKNLVIAESKVRGPKDFVWAYTSHSREKYGNIFDYDDVGYLSFLKNVKLICKDGMVFNDFRKMVKSITVQLISNYYIHPDEYIDVNNDIYKKVKRSIPQGFWGQQEPNSTSRLISSIAIMLSHISDD